MENLDLGLQPLCNRFVKKNTKEDYHHNLSLTQEKDSGLVKITNPIPPNKMQARYKWLTETEPSVHFADVAKLLNQLPNISKESKILNFSYRDKPLSRKLNAIGFRNLVEIENNNDTIGVANIQNDLSKDNFTDKIKNQHGKFDLLLANRILHHVHDLKSFFNSIRKLITDEGYVVIEVPDCERGLSSFDYNIIFEEHVYYFTKDSLINIIKENGFEIVKFKSYSFPFEDALVAIIKKSNNSYFSASKKIVFKEIKLFNDFVFNFNKQKKSVNSFFSKKSNDGSIVFFGAGHHGITFVNIMKIKKYVECFIDDVVEKQKLLIPGSYLPIYSSSYLKNNKVSTCIISVSQENEELVFNKIKSVLDKTANIFSIFPDSPISLPIYKELEKII